MGLFGGGEKVQTTNQTQTQNQQFSQSELLKQFQSFFQNQQQRQEQQQQQQTSATGTTDAMSQLQQLLQRQTTQQTGVDASSQAFIDQMRQQALGGAGLINAGQFAPGVGQINELTQGLLNPFTQQVVQGVGTEFDRLRDQASTRTRQQATQAGAFGGNRASLLEGTRLGELDRNQAQLQAQLLSQGFSQAQQSALPLAAQQAAAPAQALAAQQALLRGGLGPTGQVTTGTQTQQTTAQQQEQERRQELKNQILNALGISSGSTSGRSGSTTQGTQSGSSSGTSTLQGRTTEKQEGGLFGDILGLGLTLAGTGFNPFGALSFLGGGGGD